MRYLVIVCMLVFGCKTKHQNGNPESISFTPDFTKGPPTLVYKTKKDYNDLVAVWLSDDKSRIVAYPGIKDISTPKGFPLPTSLNDGYLLDNRGINKNAAFLKLTYEKYSKLDSLPTTAEMYEWIKNKEPLITLCDCGSRQAFADIKSQLNALIDAGQLKTVCHVMK
ncbi:MAG TPA: hypothetical protein VFG10_14105 [Saprospiraceae bacterium]|nr:hypothetical protein [Saprospiraceae bacterium]